MDKTEQTCPFCKSEINVQAVICPHCQAVKGYRTRYGMRSKAYVTAYAILLGAVTIFICVLVLALSPATFLTWVMLLMAAFSAIGGVIMFREASSGPHWYKGV